MKTFETRNDGRVDMYDVSDMTRWCERFGCTKQELRDAVTAVGTSAEAVRDYISNARHGMLAGSPRRSDR